MLITHFGLGICSYSSLTAGAIFFVTVPDTIITSDCLGDGQGTMPKRSRSCRAMNVDIISIAQQASPKVSGHSDDLRPHAISQSAGICMIPGKICRYAALPCDGLGGDGSRVLTWCRISADTASLIASRGSSLTSYTSMIGLSGIRSLYPSSERPSSRHTAAQTPELE